MARELPQIGDVIARKYRIDRELGRGGMGCVLAVTHLVTGRKLALKCLLPELLERSEGGERLRREAAAIGRIQHRYVIDVFDTLDDEGLFFIVMPLIDGITYGQLLARGVPLGQALRVLSRVMEGVAAAHAVDVVHRDLKPSNILVCRGAGGEYDDPRILDFGISKILAADNERLTASGAALGTPLYMPLEQLTGARHVDARTDVFALGLMLFETVTGRLPHLANNVGALVVERMTVPVPRLALLRPELPRSFAEVVELSLSNDPDVRPSLAALMEAVAGAATDVPLVTHATAGEARTTRPRASDRSQGLASTPSLSAREETGDKVDLSLLPRPSGRPAPGREARPRILLLAFATATLVSALWFARGFPMRGSPATGAVAPGTPLLTPSEAGPSQGAPDGSLPAADMPIATPAAVKPVSTAVTVRRGGARSRRPVPADERATDAVQSVPGDAAVVEAAALRTDRDQPWTQTAPPAPTDLRIDDL